MKLLFTEEPDAMDTDRKKLQREASRWLRVGTLTFTTLVPAINSFITRLRQANEANEDDERTQSALSEQQKHLQAAGAALSDILAELKASPYSQELLKRGEELAGVLGERSNELSHLITTRSSELSQRLTKGSRQVTKELKKRVRQEKREQREQRKTLLIGLGFGLGLTVTSIITFQIIRQRLRQQSEEETPLEIPYTSSHNGASVDKVTVPSTPSTIASVPVQTVPVRAVSAETATDTPPLEGSENRPAAATAAPADAAFIGVVSNKHYYPIETPLDVLALPGGKTVDVVYFTSEEDAQTQGFLPGYAQ